MTTTREQEASLHDARIFAVWAHGDQKYGDRPYSFHLDEVTALVLESLSGTDPSSPVTLSGVIGCEAWFAEAAVGFLHDVLEDTAVRLTELRLRFGPHIAGAVEIVTDPPGKSRRERKALLNRRLAGLDPDLAVPRTALIVKSCDRLANMRNCALSGNSGLLEMYRREAPGFREAAFRPGLCDRVWEELDALSGR